MTDRTDRAGILVVGPSWVGDMVMAQSLFKRLAGRAPGRPIDVLAPGWSLPLIRRMPEVRRGIEMPLGHGELGLGRRRALGRSLRGAGYGQAIVLPRSFKSALVPFFARIPRRTGFRGEWRYGLINDMRPFDPAALDQTVKRFLALGAEQGEPPGEIPAPELQTDKDNQQTLVDRLTLDLSRAPVAMMPGAEYGPSKRWPLEHYARLAAALGDAGRDVWILGSTRDREAGEQISAASAARNLCGETRLEDAVDLLALCDDAVTNDSGLMHIAAAVGCHVVALYGSTTPAFTPPLTARKTVHYLALECSPCFERHCPLGHHRCLRDVPPEAVLASLAAPSSAPESRSGEVSR